LIYDEALEVLDQSDSRGRSIILNNLGNVYNSTGKVDEAIDTYLQSLKLKEEIGDRKGILGLSNNLANAYQNLGEISKAKGYAEQAYEAADVLGDIHLLRDLSYKLFQIYKIEGRYEESLKSLENFLELQDSIANIDRASALAELEEKYEDEVNEKKIIELELANRKSESQRNVFIFVGAILLLAFLFISVWFFNAKKYTRLLGIKNNEISKALDEKEILIKEIHHRVKNNLQTISSLLHLQSRYVDDETKHLVNEGRNRVKSMALIHQRLYQSDDIKGIKLPDYLGNLAQSLFDSYNIRPGKISFNPDIDPLNLDVDTAIPVGLIVNELISNTLKYAFPDDKEGELIVSLKQKNDALELKVSDDGVGMPSDFNADESKGFGMRLIQVLGEKLEATLSITSGQGTQVFMKFKNYQLA